MKTMSKQVRTILGEALALDESDRESLANQLLLSLPDDILGDFPPELLREWERRADRMADGTVAGIPWEEIRAKLRRIVGEPSDTDRASTLGGSSNL